MEETPAKEVKPQILFVLRLVMATQYVPTISKEHIPTLVSEVIHDLSWTAYDHGIMDAVALAAFTPNGELVFHQRGPGLTRWTTKPIAKEALFVSETYAVDHFQFLKQTYGNSLPDRMLQGFHMIKVVC